ncbi:MAG: NAD(P)/FAD-dependent oxidoreductase [Candidatus Heimdallarchaeota archaeon]|nr:NAD(P)/FAD-dependent oxidoreductase [Candidatus Heimdallarchaeota archaeon]
MNYCDLAIIGAGPVGSLAAWASNKSSGDLSVKIFEKRPKIGTPVHCSGLMSIKGLQRLSLTSETLKNNLGFNEIRRAKFVAPDHTCLEINRGKNAMVVLNREVFDRYLANRANQVGCEINLNHLVDNLTYNQDHWKISVKEGKEKILIKTKIVILSEGINGTLTRSLGLKPPKKQWTIPAIQYEFEKAKNIEPDCVELYFGEKYAPGFFAWAIPISESSIRLGVGVKRAYSGFTRRFLQNFLQHPLIQPRIKNANLIKTYGGVISASGPIPRTYKKNLMIVGDAAGQTKATTGGGVNVGGFCGIIAGSVARKILDGSPITCKEYEKNWKSYFEPDLTLMKIFRRIMTPLSDNSWNDIIKIAKETDIGEKLNNSEIDLHGVGLAKYSLQPNILAKGFRLIPQMCLSALKGFFGK